MAENDGGGDEGEATRQPAAAASAAPAAPPPRPTISLPARGGPFGFAGNASPGPMTLASRLFFSEDPDAECRSFTQLLAGAMASPSAMSRKLGNLTPGEGQVGSSGGAPEEKGSEDESAGGSGGGGLSPLRQSQPVGTLVVPSPMFTIPPGLSPAGLLDSPGFFPSAPGYAGISHQQVLAQVTAQAAWSQSQMQNPPEYSAPLSTFTEASMAQPAMPTGDSVTFVQMPNRTADTNNATLESVDCYHSDQRSQPPTLNVDKPVDDGYNWRKYGQKQVKGSEYPRSYYKCTHPNCPVKKKVERSIDGQVTEIIYKGQHNHKKPPPGRRAREGGALPSEANGITDVTETGSHVHSRNFNGLNETTGLSSRREQESGQTTADHLSSSSDGEDVVNTELRTDEGDDNEPDSKRSRIVETGEIRQVSSQKAVTEPRIIVQTTSEVDLLDDGYRWRKYGQKVVKGNPNPRSYYKCTYAGCNVRKHVERASTDHKAVITTYEGKHNHDVPTARHSSHKMPNSSSGNVIQPKPLHAASNQVLLRTEFSSNNPHPVAEILRLKEEHDIT